MRTNKDHETPGQDYENVSSGNFRPLSINDMPIPIKPIQTRYSQNVENMQKSRTLLLRICAFLFDCFIVIAFCYAIKYVFINKIGFRLDLKYLIIVNIAAFWLYMTLLESSNWRATIGKKLFRLIVLTSDEEGLNFFQATGRFICFTFYSLFIAPIIVIFNIEIYSFPTDFMFSQRILNNINNNYVNDQFLYDLMSGTQVIKKQHSSERGLPG